LDTRLITTMERGRVGAPRTRIAPLLLALTLLFTACTPVGPANSGPANSGPANSGPASQPTSQAVAGAPKHLTVAIMSDPQSVGPEAGSVSGVQAVRGLLQAGLANPNEQDEWQPQLAVELPSLENGLWQVLPDGSMETTWHIRPAATWHDGVPFTSDDVVFTAQVAQDPELPGFRNRAYQLVNTVEAVDPQTVVVRWKQPYIGADKLFGNPLPRHLLEDHAMNAKAAFTQLPYWSDDYIGTGPFKLARWVRDSHLVLEANDAYVLGRPRIDELEVRLIPDPNALMAGVLAGTVDLPIGRTVSIDQGLALRDQWQGGHVEIIQRPGWSVIYPQLTHTNPPVVGDQRFRRALLEAIDRQQLVDTLVHGLSSVADTILPAGRADYAPIKDAAPHSAYDPRAAEQTIEALGYTKDSDGTFRDSAGQPLAVELRTSGENDNDVKLMFAVTGFWQQVGVVATAFPIPSEQRDRQYRATYPGFQLFRHPDDESWLGNFVSDQAPSAANNWTGSNPGSYRDPGYDALYTRYTQTLPVLDRLQLAGQLVYQLDDELVAMGLFYDNLTALIGLRLQHVVVPQQYETQYTWSAYLWDIQ